MGGGGVDVAVGVGGVVAVAVGVGGVVAVAVGVGVGACVDVAVGDGPGCVGVGVGWWRLLLAPLLPPLFGPMRSMAKQRAKPCGTAPQTCLNEYPLPADGAAGAEGAAGAAPTPPTRTIADIQRETMVKSVARMRTPRRMCENPSCAHANDTWHGQPAMPVGHATPGVIQLPRPRRRCLEIENGQAWKDREGRTRASAGYRGEVCEYAV